MPRLPSHAQVVVIGGGAVGASAAYHLAKLGYTDIVVLERNSIGGGTTWHSAAGVNMTSENPENLRCFRYALSELKTIEKDTDLSVGRKEIGRLIFSYNEESLARIRRASAHGRSADFPLQVLTPAETLDRLPILSPEGLLGGLWNPNAFCVDPSGFVEALFRLARRRGVTVVENARVTSIAADNRIRSVTTEEGTIHCEIVVNCAGIWSREVAAMVNLQIPIVANEHFYVLTKPIDGMPSNIPSFRAGDDLFYGRGEVGGLLLGVFDENARGTNVSDLPNDFSFGLLPERWEQLTPYVDRIVEKLPIFSTAEIKSFINGPEAFTPDHRYILGESDRISGFYTLAGMNSGGITTCLWAGRQLAELIVQGSPTEDLSRVDICRFHEFEGSDEWLRLTGPDLSSDTYIYGRPDPVQKVRNIRLSPVHAVLEAQQANFEPVCGWEVAASFGSSSDSISAELSLLNAVAGIVDQSHFGKVRLSGLNATNALRKVVVESLPEIGSAGKKLIVANARGGVEAIPISIPLDVDDWLLLVEPAEAPQLRRCLSAVAPQSRVGDETSGWAQFLIAGPNAHRIVQAYKGFEDVSGVRKGYIGVAPVVFCPVDTGFIILVATEYAVALYKFVLQHSRETVARFGPIGSAAVEEHRIAQGFPKWGRDVNAFVPAAIGSAGTDGHMDKILVLRTTELEGGHPRIHAPVWSDEACVGYVTSAGTASAGENPTVLARISGKLGPELWIDTGEGLVRAEVISS